MWSLVPEARALIRRSPGRRRAASRPGQVLAGALLATLFVGLQLMTSRADPPRAVTPLAAGLAPRTAVTAVYHPASPAPTTPGPGASLLSSSSSPPGDQEVQVQPGDSLWTISGREYGNPQEWTAIWGANQGQTEDNGETFTDPSVIDPGWDLEVPNPSPRPRRRWRRPGPPRTHRLRLRHRRRSTRIKRSRSSPAIPSGPSPAGSTGTPRTGRASGTRTRARPRTTGRP